MDESLFIPQRYVATCSDWGKNPRIQVLGAPFRGGRLARRLAVPIAPKKQSAIGTRTALSSKLGPPINWRVTLIDLFMRKPDIGIHARPTAISFMP